MVNHFKRGKEMKKYFFALLTLGLIAFAAACGSVYEKEPVGIGPDYSELKKSPCACLELEKMPQLPDWLS